MEDEYRTAEDAVTDKGAGQIYAWVPAYDNYDGSERFWRHYELSLIDTAAKR